MFVGLTSQFFHNALESRPFLRLQRDELEPDAAVAAPPYDALLNDQRRVSCRGVDMEFHCGAGMHDRRTDDATPAHRQVDDGSVTSHAVD